MSARTWLVLLLLASPVGAQQVPARLSVDDALRLAREHNPALRRVENDAGVAGWQLRQAWSALLPSVNASLGFQAGQSTRTTGEDDYGRPVESPITRTFKSSSATQGMSASLTLFDGGASLRALGARRADVRATDAAIRAQAVQLEAQVRRLFYAAMRAQQNILLEQQLLASAKDRLERAEALLRLAASDQVDVLGARADVATQQQKLERTQGDAEKARLDLLQVMGLSGAGTFELVGEPPAAFDASALSADSLVAVALARHPQIAQRQAMVDAAKSRASAARGSRLPQLQLNGSVGRSMSAADYGAVGELNPQNSNTGLGLTVTLPLFNRFSTTVQVAQLSAAEEDAREELRALQLQLGADVRAAHIDLVNAFRSLELARLSADLSRERLQLAQEKFRLGAISFTELQNVIDRTAQAERSELDARFGFVAARIQLEEMLGTALER